MTLKNFIKMPIKLNVKFMELNIFGYYDNRNFRRGQS